MPSKKGLITQIIIFSVTSEKNNEQCQEYYLYSTEARKWLIFFKHEKSINKKFYWNITLIDWKKTK